MATHKGFTASQRVSKNAGLIVPVGAALGLFLDPLVNVQTLCPRSPGQELLNTLATFGAGDVQCVLRAVLLVRQAWPGPLDQFGVPPVGCTRRRCITGEFVNILMYIAVSARCVWLYQPKLLASKLGAKTYGYGRWRGAGVGACAAPAKGTSGTACRSLPNNLYKEVEQVD